MKNFFTFLIGICVFMNLFSLNYANTTKSNVKSITFKIGDPKMYVDGVIKDIDPGKATSPIIINGRSFIPLRSLIEILGGKITWTQNENLITINLQSDEIKLWVNNNITYVNSKKIMLDTPPIILNSRTMLPLRFITENLGFSVTWNPVEKTILIDTSKPNSVNLTNNESTYITYTILQGDSLWNISKKFNVPVETIMELNQLTSDKIYLGQIIKIPLSNTNPINTNSMDTKLIEGILSANKTQFGGIMKNLNKYEVQVLYTKIDRNSANIPTFTSYQYNLNENNYFYPASSVKLAASALALEKINNLKIPGLNKFSPMKIDAYKNQSGDSGTIANYIKNMLVSSNNNCFDRLYEFLGQEYFNTSLWKKGFNKSLIIHRLGNVMTYEQNRYTNPITFTKDGNKIYAQEPQYNKTQYSNKGLNNLLRGKGEKINNTIKMTPKDFTYKNYMSINVLQNILKSIIFPDYVPEAQKFNLTNEDRSFIMDNMKNCNLDCKYFICGTKNPVPSGMKIYNKSGIAYGNIIDNAYIVDSNSKAEFLLTAVIYVNDDGILGDSNYEYQSIGIPFLKNLSYAMYEYTKNN